MHGGAAGSGAPKGNQNALKDGLYTAGVLVRRRALARIMRDTSATLKEYS